MMFITYIDFEKITMFVGNYDFWYKSSELIQKQMKDSNKKKEEKIYVVDKPVKYSVLKKEYKTREEIAKVLLERCNELGRMTFDEEAKEEQNEEIKSLEELKNLLGLSKTPEYQMSEALVPKQFLQFLCLKYTDI